MTLHTASPNDFTQQVLVPLAEWSSIWPYAAGDYTISGNAIWIAVDPVLGVTPVSPAWTEVVSGASIPATPGVSYSVPCLSIGDDTDNQTVVCGAATGDPVTISAAGSDADIPIQFMPKGTPPTVYFRVDDSTSSIALQAINNTAFDVDILFYPQGEGSIDFGNVGTHNILNTRPSTGTDPVELRVGGGTVDLLIETAPANSVVIQRSLRAPILYSGPIATSLSEFPGTGTIRFPDVGTVVSDAAIVGQELTNYGDEVQILSLGLNVASFPRIILGDSGFGSLSLDFQAQSPAVPALIPSASWNLGSEALPFGALWMAERTGSAATFACFTAEGKLVESAVACA